MYNEKRGYMKINKDLLKDDLFDAVNKEYLDSLEIPGDRKATGVDLEIELEIEKQLQNDFKNLAFDDAFVTSEMVNFLKFYRSIVANHNRSVTPNHPVYEMINKITSISNKDELNAVLIELREINCTPFFSIQIEPSFKDSSLNILFVTAPKTLLPAKEFYEDKARKDELIPILKDVMLQIFEIFGVKDGANIFDLALDLDVEVAKYIKSTEELADYTKYFNPVSYDELVKMSDFIDFDKHIKHFIKKDVTEISITEPRVFGVLNQLYNEQNLDKMKALMLVSYLYYVSDLFDEELRHLKAKYKNSLSGIAEVKKLDRFAFDKSMEIYEQVVGLYYGEKYFGEEAKKDVYDMVDKIIKMYQKRLTENPWLQEETKQKANLKLGTMKVMMGYPDSLPEIYKQMTYDENLSLYENYIDNLKKHQLDKLAKYGEKVDHSIWEMPSCMVNAYYNPSFNLICFPAAILKEPFYSLKQTKSQNFGGIGAVIGHEISHAFDNNGANFDENGNMNNWWQESDFAEFKKLTNRMIKQFDGIEIGGGKVNGTQVVSENLADVGGLACAVACLKEESEYNLQEFFCQFARSWAAKFRKEFQELMLKTDVHAPAKLRANIHSSNMDEYYQTFDVKEGDGMYLAPEERIIVW